MLKCDLEERKLPVIHPKHSNTIGTKGGKKSYDNDDYDNGNDDDYNDDEFDDKNGDCNFFSSLHPKGP